jgi:hypothetical protein
MYGANYLYMSCFTLFINFGKYERSLVKDWKLLLTLNPGP